MKTLVGYPHLEAENYHKDKVPREIVALSAKVWTKYSTLPSVEIWNEEALYDTLDARDLAVGSPQARRLFS